MIEVSEAEWKAFKEMQEKILRQMKGLSQKEQNTPGISVNYITAKEFMDTVRIKRTKFDELVQQNKIKIIKKTRKIYVPVEEVERYFASSDK